MASSIPSLVRYVSSPGCSVLYRSHARTVMRLSLKFPYLRPRSAKPISITRIKILAGLQKRLLVKLRGVEPLASRVRFWSDPSRDLPEALFSAAQW